MIEVLSDAWSWLQPIGETIWPWVWSAVIFIFSVAFLLGQILIRLVFWGVLMLAIPAVLLGGLTYGANALLGGRDHSSGPVARTVGWGLASMALATLVLCAMIVGGLGQYISGLVEQATLFSGWSYSVWVKRVLGLIGGGIVVIYCCCNDFTSSLLDLVDRRSQQFSRKVILPVVVTALLTGFLYPVAFERPRSAVLNLGDRVVAKLTGAEIPPELKGSVYQGVVTGSTADGRFYGFATHQEITVAFGVETPFLAIDGLPVPCVVRGNQIIVSTYRTESIWLDMSYDERSAHLYYSMKSSIGDDVYTTEGLLLRQAETITDEELMTALVDAVSS